MFNRDEITAAIACELYNGLNLRGVSEAQLDYTIQRINQTAVKAADNLILQLKGEGGTELIDARREQLTRKTTERESR